MTTAQKPDALSMALSEPSRRAILEKLRLGHKSVSQLVQATGLKQPNVSNHLAKMRLQNIVHAERRGREVFYSIALPVTDLLLRLHEFTTEALRTEHTIPIDYSNVPLDPGNGNIHPREGKSPKCSVKALGLPERLPLTEWRSDFLENILAGQEERAQSIVHEMLARRVSLPIIYSELFQHALDRIGGLYENGETDIAHEHRASALVERMMARVNHFYAPVMRLPYRALLACVAGNLHCLGLRMISDALRAQGWGVDFLGADVPTESLLSIVPEVQPDLVVLSCSMQEQSQEMRRAVGGLIALRESLPDRRYQIAVGGLHVCRHGEVAKEISADITAQDLVGFLERVRSEFPTTFPKK